MIKGVIYARVSSREQEKEGFSIPAQLELLRNYALNNNITVVKEFEDAETAKKEGRTNYNEMLKFIKSSKDVNTILVEKTDRLYRNFKDYVTLEDYDDVQIAFKKDNKPQYKNPKDFLFANILRCSNCGCQISGQIKKGKYVYYSCTGGKGECEQKHVYIREEELEKQYIEALRRVQLTKEQKEWIIQALKESLVDEQEFVKERVSELNKQKASLKDRLSKIYLDKLDGIISEQFWLERHNKWTDDLTSINTSIQAYEKCNSDYMTIGVNILNTLCDIERCYLLSDTGCKRTLSMRNGYR